MKALFKLALIGLTWPVQAQAINYVIPGQGPIGQCLEIVGTGMTGVTSVMFGSVPATAFTIASNTHIIAAAPPHSSGSVTVSVK